MAIRRDRQALLLECGPRILQLEYGRFRIAGDDRAHGKVAESEVTVACSARSAFRQRQMAQRFEPDVANLVELRSRHNRVNIKLAVLAGGQSQFPVWFSNLMIALNISVGGAILFTLLALFARQRQDAQAALRAEHERAEGDEIDRHQDPGANRDDAGAIDDAA